MENKNFVVIGVGPHFKRNYVPFFKKNELSPSLVVELKSKESETREYINKLFGNVDFLFLDDEYKDDLELPQLFKNKLNVAINRHNIAYAFIVTEAKSHYAYSIFFLDNNINTLTEKPITAPKNIRSIDDIEWIKKSYDNLMEHHSKYKASLSVMCQRNYHTGYNFILSQLKDVVRRYNVPVTSINIDHCDGNWILPHDLFYENHPYKYGYGKLFHSGYHFIDLLATIIKINTELDDSKKPYKMMTCSLSQDFDDMNSIINTEDYRRIFNQDIKNDDINLKYFGEMNTASLHGIYSKENKLITMAQMNINQLGFSRRGWYETNPDHYKGNGRVRHEHINIQVGPLMNIVVNSYQSKQSKDRSSNEVDAGGLDHFDIHIFRNTDIIGGKANSLIRSSDLLETENMGLNEEAREKCFADFLQTGKGLVTDLEHHALGIQILYTLTKQRYIQAHNCDDNKTKDIVNISKMLK